MKHQNLQSGRNFQNSANSWNLILSNSDGCIVLKVTWKAEAKKLEISQSELFSPTRKHYKKPISLKTAVFEETFSKICYCMGFYGTYNKKAEIENKDQKKPQSPNSAKSKCQYSANLGLSLN